MNMLVPIALFGWIPAVLVLFALLPARRAALTAFLIAWLFLPIASYKTPGLPPLTKTFATCLGVLPAVLLLDGQRLVSLRFRWIDLPMFAWCIAPLAASISNELGLHDGLSASLGQTISWAVPYLIGRLYFQDLEGLKELALGIFLGGLVYVPLCLLEVRMSPQLHIWVYGFHQHDWDQVLRGGGYRPTVFMQHGLAVSMWMVAASLVGAWLWLSGAVQRIGGWRLGPLVLLVVLTAVLCKSVGALVLLGLGVTCLLAARRLHLSRHLHSLSAIPLAIQGPVLGLTALAAALLCNVRRAWLPAAAASAALLFACRRQVSLVLLIVAATPVVYLASRVGGWDGRQMIEMAALYSQDRAASLGTRLWNEELLTDKALEQPVFGWGSWGRNFVTDPQTGEITTVTDSLWILTLGTSGLFGLISLMGVLLLPPGLLVMRWRAHHWRQPPLAAPIALAMLLLLYTLDCLFNAMINPIFMLCAGGLAGLVSAPAPRPVPVILPSSRPPWPAAFKPAFGPGSLGR